MHSTALCLVLLLFPFARWRAPFLVWSVWLTVYTQALATYTATWRLPDSAIGRVQALVLAFGALHETLVPVPPKGCGSLGVAVASLGIRLGKKEGNGPRSPSCYLAFHDTLSFAS